MVLLFFLCKGKGYPKDSPCYFYSFKSIPNSFANSSR